MSYVWLRLKRFGVQLLVVALALFQLMLWAPNSVRAASTTLVISEVQFGGASAADEFVELYNTTAAPIDLTALGGVGLKLHIRNSTGTNDDSKLLTFVNTTIPAHGYFLIVRDGANATLTSLADATYDGSSGTTLVANGAAYISTSDADATAVIDLVGWGTQPVGGFEGVAAVSFGANKSIERLPGGINANGQDTDDNSVDFQLLITPEPQNSTSGNRPVAPAAPVLGSVVEGDGQVTLQWSAIVGAKDYIVYQDGVALPAPVVSPVVTKTVLGLTNGTTYTFEVSARNLTNMEGAKSNSQTGTPAAPIVVPPSPIPASVAYYATGSSVAASQFGVTSVRAEVTTSPVDALTSADAPTLTLTRPHSAAVTLPLTFDSVKGVWATTTDYVVSKSQGNQDGSVVATLATVSAKTVSFTAGESFSADTTVNAPAATAVSRCSTNQDSFSATTDADVTQVFVYKAADANLANLVAVAPATSGHVDEVFTGDNVFGTLYLVAEDGLGNRSVARSVVNDVTAPAVPRLQIEAGNGTLTASWAVVDGADSYVVRWKATTASEWQQQTVTATQTSLSAINGTLYDVQVASRDAACNQSNFADVSATPQDPAQTVSAKGGLTTADTESMILSEAIMVAETKDGEASLVSPFSLEEDKDQNGIKDSQEDKNNNGIPDGQEGQTQTSSSPSPSSSSSQVKDRSRLIITLAVLLILAGAALAAYSWYRGDDEATPSEAVKEPKTEAESAPPAPVDSTEKKEAVEKKDKPKKGGGRKRKTRW